MKKKNILYASAAAAAFTLVPAAAIMAEGTDQAPEPINEITPHDQDILDTNPVLPEEDTDQDPITSPENGAGPAAQEETTEPENNGDPKENIETPEKQPADQTLEQEPAAAPVNKVEEKAVAQDPVVVENITANTKVGDGQREVYSFDITIKDPSTLKDLSAKDFDITGNAPTTVADKTTADFFKEYADDELKLAWNNNILTLSFRPFSYNGLASGTPWKVTCLLNDALSFDSSKVNNVKTEILDDAIRGKKEYAGLVRDYALYIPKDENGQYMTNVPLVVWNHGGGEYNGDLENTLVANKGLTGWIEQGYKVAVLQMQVANPNYSYGTAADAFGPDNANKVARRKLIDQNNALQASLIRDLIQSGLVNKDRVYVTGASSGGGATMRFLMQYPELFAGAIACCSMDPIVWVHWNNNATLDELVANFEKAFQDTVYTWDDTKKAMVEKPVDTETLINVPIFFTHAQNDPTCSVRSSQAMYHALNNLGAKNNRLTIWSDEEMEDAGLSSKALNKALLHWSWVKVFNDNGPEAPMTWLMAQTKEVPSVPDQPSTPDKPSTPADEAQAEKDKKTDQAEASPTSIRKTVKASSAKTSPETGVEVVSGTSLHGMLLSLLPLGLLGKRKYRR